MKLGDLCHIARGGSPRPIQDYLTDEADGINWIKISDATASDKYIEYTKEKIRPEGLKKSRLVKPGDFILSNSMSFGRPYIMKMTGCIHDGWLVLSDKCSLFDPDFLYYFLGSDAAYRQFDGLAAGSTVRNLNSDLVKTVDVPVPPLDEQQRIVAVLDKAFAGIATATANAQKNLTNARALFESYANDAFDELTLAVVKRPTLETLTEAKSGITYGVVKPGDIGSIPFVRGGDLIDGEVRLDRLRTITDEVSAQYDRTLLRGGELLMCLVGVPGQCAIAPPELAGANIARQVGLIRLRPDVNAEYVKDYLQSPPGQKSLGTFTGGSVQQVINLGDLRHVEIPLPDRSKQDEMVSRISIAKSLSGDLAQTFEAKLTALTELKKSLLQKAFAGELT